jgi:hypothetical protein
MDVNIVKNHQPFADIVIPNNASVQIKNAAKILQQYIQQSTNALLPITSNSQRSTTIEIGNTSFVKSSLINISGLDEDGFIVNQTDGYHIAIVGGGDWGTEYGVYWFLEKYIGVHWLMPSDIGTDIPSRASIVIPGIEFTDSPVYLSRQISPYYVEWTDIFSVWSRFNRFRGRISFGHNLLNLFNPKEYLKTNPNFYSQVNGRLEIPKDYKWQPNFSAPGIADTAASKIIRYFTKYPGESSYSLGINDWPVFDESAKSLLRRNGKKNYLGREDVSDDYFRWVNEVVKKVLTAFPNKYFGLLAYNNVAQPPSPNIGVAPHVIPFLTYERMRWADSSLKQQGHQLNEAWGQECSELGWYDYAYGLSYLVPRVWFHEMKDYLQWGSEHQAKHYYAELYPNWGEGPKPWVLGKLLWNPNYNVDSLLNVWYNATAGKRAAPKLQEFYRVWEQFWTSDIFKTPWNSDSGQYLFFNNFSYLQYIPKEYVSRCDELMNDAYNLSESDVQKERVSELLQMWQLYKLAIQLYQNPSVPENKKQEYLSQSPEFIAMLNKLSNDPMHADSTKWIKGQLKIK